MEQKRGAAWRAGSCPAAYDLRFPAALNGLQFLSGKYLKKPLVVEDGEIEVPMGAGLGVEIGEVRIKL